MLNQKYTLRYLPLFYEELEAAVLYIASRLGNPSAAENLLNNVENAILERVNNNPEGYEPVPSRKKRDYPYYRIYVGNYIVYYVVIPEGNERIMEVRRFVHTLQNRDNI
ncbi:ParE toxin of type II toxin-antitoxin system, parDE [Butyrivibrio sp. INlla18]|uniref:ParE toxin of type II toxin-antitoxin system, parDE n=1 Tax=Butyrivibrio hungatei DSM 14810 TaxID=1121132 RepID=A0A1M7T0K7_9FIRM|nr:MULTISPECIES: type II toxin-antitoxin system RelE/ParE family toxin [Butyrivibrio]SDA69801.1 ParE toxin of type II toxin-antitoxin system, parDE [Butyrivibrio sp. INlla18]SHN64266.1 ParE toxin of type II toxin-antitoxin system, parDE [Butyrivibrio hungatei DSM 14810]